MKEPIETIVAVHERRLNDGDKKLDGLQKQLGGIFNKIDELKTAVLTRPSWFVATVITFLVGLVSAMATYLIFAG